MSSSNAPGQSDSDESQVTRLPTLRDMLPLIEHALAVQSDVLIITAVEGRSERIVYANPAIEAHSGYSVAEVIGKSPKMFQGPETSRQTLDRIRSAIDECRPVRAELLNYGKSGASYWTEIDISPIFDAGGKASHMVAVQRDVTQRNLTYEAARRSDQRFRLALKASANAVWDWDIATGEVEFRDELAGHWWNGQLHGNKRGNDLSVLLDLIHPDDRDHTLRSLLEKIAGTDQLHIAEYRFKRPDGSFAHVSDRQFILRGPDGKAERLIGSLLDISEKHEVERRRHKSQRLELLGEMTGGIAHNFNNLLTVILGNVDRLREEQSIGSQSIETIQLIDKAVQRGAKLTEDLMSFSHGRAMTLAPVDVRQLVERAVPDWTHLLSPKITLHVKSDAALWPVKSDKAQLEAVLLNLVLNARDAMPDGGTLFIGAENVPAGSDLLRAETREQSLRYVMISVEDTGSGMPPEHAKMAFDPFFTTKAPGEGSGLGLSSAHGFLKQSGGFIRLQSELHMGTTISVFLQASDREPEPERDPQPWNIPSDGGHCILVVDDDAMVREFVRTVLLSLDYKVLVAENGEEAMRVLKSGSKVDLLFTDILMDTDMSGWDLACQARALFPELPVLFTSAYPDSVEQPQTVAGAIKLLRKPYRIRDLSIAILSAIAVAESRKPRA